AAAPANGQPAATPPPAANADGRPAQSPPPPAAATPGGPVQLSPAKAEALQDLESALTAAQDAQRNGDFAEYGQALQRLNDAMRKYDDAK
ncbi:hypothetical protein EB74_33530, partial [Mycobacterium sp. SWH-M5]